MSLQMVFIITKMLKYDTLAFRDVVNGPGATRHTGSHDGRLVIGKLLTNRAVVGHNTTEGGVAWWGYSAFTSKENRTVCGRIETVFIIKAIRMKLKLSFILYYWYIYWLLQTASILKFWRDDSMRGIYYQERLTLEDEHQKLRYNSPAEKLADHPFAGRSGSELNMRNMAPESAVRVMVGGLLAENPLPECRRMPWEEVMPSYTCTVSFSSTSKSLNCTKEYHMSIIH